MTPVEASRHAVALVTAAQTLEADLVTGIVEDIDPEDLVAVLAWVVGLAAGLNAIYAQTAGIDLLPVVGAALAAEADA